MKHHVVLTNEDHHYHPLNFNFTGDTPPTPTDDGGVIVEHEGDASEIRVTCIACNVRLLPDEDFSVEEREAWQA